MIGLSIRAVGALMLGLWSVVGSRADSVADFYRGRTVEVYVGYSTGGGYDIYARALARHMGRYIPGNPKLVVTRVTGFGQDGPYAGRPGFASIAEALSGFVAVNGESGPDSQPLLPPIALTDEVTGLAAAFATLVAVHSGVGQVVDVNLFESIFQMMGPVMSAFHLTGYLQPRLGSGIPYSVPRGT